MTIKCSRCGKMYTGSDEWDVAKKRTTYDTEFLYFNGPFMWFNNHVCHGLPKLSEMTTEEIIAEMKRSKS